MIESLKTDFLKSEDQEIIKQGIEMLLTLEMVEESYEAFKTILEQRVAGEQRLGYLEDTDYDYALFIALIKLLNGKYNLVSSLAFDQCNELLCELDLLGTFENVYHFELSDINPKDSEMLITSNPQMKHLNISGAFPKIKTPLKDLTSFSIENANIGDVFEFIDGQESLESLSLSSLSLDTYSKAFKCSKLNDAELLGFDTKHIIDILEQNPQLTHLSTHVSYGGVLVSTTSTARIEPPMDFNYNHDLFKRLELWIAHKHVKSFDVVGFKGAEVNPLFELNPHMEYLSMRQCTVIKKTTLSELKEVSFESMKWKQVISFLKLNPQLESLSLNNINFNGLKENDTALTVKHINLMSCDDHYVELFTKMNPQAKISRRSGLKTVLSSSDEQYVKKAITDLAVLDNPNETYQSFRHLINDPLLRYCELPKLFRRKFKLAYEFEHAFIISLINFLNPIYQITKEVIFRWQSPPKISVLSDLKLLNMESITSFSFREIDEDISDVILEHNPQVQSIYVEGAILKARTLPNLRSLRIKTWDWDALASFLVMNPTVESLECSVESYYRKRQPRYKSSSYSMTPLSSGSEKIHIKSLKLKGDRCDLKSWEKFINICQLEELIYEVDSYRFQRYVSRLKECSEAGRSFLVDFENKLNILNIYKNYKQRFPEVNILINGYTIEELDQLLKFPVSITELYEPTLDQLSYLLKNHKENLNIKGLGLNGYSSEESIDSLSEIQDILNKLEKISFHRCSFEFMQAILNYTPLIESLSFRQYNLHEDEEALGLPTIKSLALDLPVDRATGIILLNPQLQHLKLKNLQSDFDFSLSNFSQLDSLSINWLNVSSFFASNDHIKLLPILEKGMVGDKFHTEKRIKEVLDVVSKSYEVPNQDRWIPILQQLEFTITLTVDQHSFNMVYIKKTNGYYAPPKAYFIAERPVSMALWDSIISDSAKAESNDYGNVCNVSWYDAVEFCNKLSQFHGLKPVYDIQKIDESDQQVNVYWNKQANGYRLPMQSEYEFVARERDDRLNIYDVDNYYWTWSHEAESGYVSDNSDRLLLKDCYASRKSLSPKNRWKTYGIRIVRQC